MKFDIRGYIYEIHLDKKRHATKLDRVNGNWMCPRDPGAGTPGQSGQKAD